LNVLASQNTGRLVVDGSIQLNGVEASASHIDHVSAYVQQEDIFFGTLKVKEHLTFQAVTRMERWIPMEQKLQRVDQVLYEMGLKKCEDTIIGIPGKIKGISGGEKKRLSFASEILTNPSLLFLDEPTSGLDSFMAEAVVKLLFKVAATGRTILCTIHQPSSEIYALFDHVLLLAEGQVAFVGPTVRTPQFFAE
jgi:ABC-type multidrug transport system ATPase subunit